MCIDGYTVYCLRWEQTSDMKSYYSDIADRISQIDPTLLTANKTKVCVVM